MHSGRIRVATWVATLGKLFVLTALAACAGHTLHTFGQYNDLAPKVAATKGERQPLHVTVQLGRAANVAVFYVVPGRGTTLLFPEDSTQSGFVDGGTHLVATAFAKNAVADSSRLIRRPAGSVADPTNPGGNPGGRGGRNGGRGGFNDTQFSGNQRGFLLIYASQEPLPYGALTTRVAGLSIPAYDDEALNTVTKLIRESARTSGPWAAFATDFPP